MTDITELAQREKFEAWWEREYKHLESSKYTDAVPHIKYGFWMAYQAGGAELVEALEKAQHEARVDWEAAASLNVENQELKRRIAELESRTVSAAAADVLAERQRQVTAEGWSSKHDDQYKNTELAFAASCYAFHAAAASWDLEDDGIPYDSHPVPKQWPWDPSWWKPTDARRDLVKAGALILAEIERIDRAAGIKWEAE
ncbi:hypothetical protein [Klebsiella michiganensis]|uniref:hypothetical protein n=1 Tax=Klebsiella michiganensis TaxID=1134687 RepID=UPI002247B2B9|nr:hypothetical protein [Klebsiella michiganensis]MCW9596636.1 hypothetical protein [Klebsiella michiganensis]